MMSAMSDLLVRGARVVSLDDGADGGAYAEPVDVLVRSGVVTAVGPRLPDAGVREVDADGRWLLPGLWDAHVHLGQWALASRRLDLSGARSPENALAVVADAVRASVGGSPVVGMGQ